MDNTGKTYKYILPITNGKGDILALIDADRLGIENGERIKVSSRRGEITATARVGRKVSEGETWMPFHFEDSPVNMLTNAALDDIARIPEYKVCAINICKINSGKDDQSDAEQPDADYVEAD